MRCNKCYYGNGADALYCQRCGAPIRQRPQKVLVLPRLKSLALRRQFAGYYILYSLFGIIGGLVLAVIAFLSFLFVFDCLGITDPAGNSGALLVLVASEIGVLAAYAALIVKIVKARVSKAVYNLPSYRRDPGARG
jgi:hypothetical protein